MNHVTGRLVIFNYTVVEEIHVYQNHAKWEMPVSGLVQGNRLVQEKTW